MVEIVESEIDVGAILAKVQTETCGAAVLFVGSTRKFTNGLETTQLIYDCYRELALKEMEQMETDAKESWPIERSHIVHRMGLVPLGSPSVAVAVSTPHRKDAFAAAQWLIDTLKVRVPIWKQEHWSDGTRKWIHPQLTEAVEFVHDRTRQVADVD
jgi:molybdopterin synthase catalytic subunit